MSKTKISITLPSDLLRRIDAEARSRPGRNRSAVIERWLRWAARSEAGERLREETVRYYESLTQEEHAEQARLSRASARLAKRVRYDD